MGEWSLLIGKEVVKRHFFAKIMLLSQQEERFNYCSSGINAIIIQVFHRVQQYFMAVEEFHFKNSQIFLIAYPRLQL
jgi:hypothetical protein